MTQASNTEQMLQASRQAFYQMSTLTLAERNLALTTFADLIAQHEVDLLTANQKDLTEQEGKLTGSLYQRLKLDRNKIQPLVQGIRDMVKLPDPLNRTLQKTELDTGLLLEKKTVALGVIGIIFESRPDVPPQILSLMLKSGNAVILKGGSEAKHSNQAFMKLVEKLNEACPFLPPHWATLLESREAVHDILNFPQYVDLIIPRGSNELVQSIQQNTKIPVLGHADGVCHVYVDGSADLETALQIVLDAKTQYPSACNAVETLLIDRSIASPFLEKWVPLAEKAKIHLKACEHLQKMNFNLAPATEADWRTEYGDLTLSMKLVDGIEVAITHINQYGSHHTDAIVSTLSGNIERFLNEVDSACVFANASTRFADGFRFGLGAEIGISTARTHARGPVGLEGLVSTKYILQGQDHIVTDYVGNPPKKHFTHQNLSR